MLIRTLDLLRSGPTTTPLDVLDLILKSWQTQTITELELADSLHHLFSGADTRLGDVMISAFYGKEEWAVTELDNPALAKPECMIPAIILQTLMRITEEEFFNIANTVLKASADKQSSQQTNYDVYDSARILAARCEEAGKLSDMFNVLVNICMLFAPDKAEYDVKFESGKTFSRLLPARDAYALLFTPGIEYITLTQVPTPRSVPARGSWQTCGNRG